MNTNSNVYTVVYSTILVVVVAAVLAFTAISLQPKQNENVKKETITKVLSAAAFVISTIPVSSVSVVFYNSLLKICSTSDDICLKYISGALPSTE